MLLDIGIPCFNEGQFLFRCLNSINQYFSNNYEDIVIWIIDDDSRYGNEYKEVILNFPNLQIKYIKMEQNSGPGICRNIVIDKGEAKWITFIDDDEVFCRNPITYLKNCDIIKSDVLNDKGSVHSSKNDTFSCVLGILYNREFLSKINLKFSSKVGIVGTEDSVFLLYSLACADSIYITSSFVTHMTRTDSNYTLSSSQSEHCSLRLLLLCNIYQYLIEYKDFIKNKNIIWSTIVRFIRNTERKYKEISSTFIQNYYLQMLYLIFYKIILDLFPTYEDFQKTINLKDEVFLNHVQQAYFCCLNKGDTLYYWPFLYENNKSLKRTLPETFICFHFPSFYEGLIQIPGIDLIKKTRKKRNFPEKYWNF